MKRPLFAPWSYWLHRTYLGVLLGAWILVVAAVLLKPHESQGVLHLLILGAMALHLIRMGTFLLADSIWKHQLSKRQIEIDSGQFPSVCVLVPCFNEEKVIIPTLQSLSRLDYPKLEILVIDDGSTDRTVELAEAFRSHSPVPLQVLQKKNSGKASSLNLGIQSSKSDLVLCVDADSQLEASGLKKAALHLMAKPKLGAVAGTVVVGNTDTHLTGLQNLEYRISNLQKSFLSLFGLLGIIPGPIGLFRREAIESVKGYDQSPGLFAEDADLTLKLIAAGWDVVYEPDLISKTEAPEESLSFLRQRYRWFRGTSQALQRNAGALLTSPRLKLKLFAAYLLTEQYLLLILESSVLLAFVLKMITSAEVEIYTASLLILLVSDLVVIRLCSNANEISLLSLIRQAFLLRFNYAVVLITWKSLSQIEESRQVTMTWDKVIRHGRLKSLDSGEAKHA